MDIAKSIFNLVNTNNGLFKSEKQATFLIGQLEQLAGYFYHSDSGYNVCPVFASWDDKGITKLVKVTRRNGIKKDVVVFERKQEGGLTSIEIKEIKMLNRDMKNVQEKIDEYTNEYTKFGRESTRYMIDKYKLQMQNILDRISQIQGIK